ncbi:hypothetical protein ADL00_02300 [Streptomyces sp. AS58]|uniref:CU044_2847 family protein n=1 Tax=Streptomyces sp. AS58 TaxID=1519489 RepID=UPI0006AE969E|nr:CU044_2847 family protein [Streptomyces sp. AS58]KOV74656.1 hypothetical protein ADL00_02300 [Streptomyces sp. AS58]
MSRLIELSDGALVEVESQGGEIELVSAGLASRVDRAADQIGPLLERICRPIRAYLDDGGEAGGAREAEVEIAIGFEGEGNAYLARAKSSAALVVRIRLEAARADGA